MQQTLNVQGMTCQHCANAVSEEVSALQGVASVRVDLVAGAISTVVVETDRELDTAEITAALDEAGEYVLV